MHLFTCIVVTHLETLMKRNLKLDLLQWVFVIIQLKVFLHHHVPFDLKMCSENIAQAVLQPVFLTMYKLLTLMIGNINVLLIIMYGQTSLSNSLNLYLKHVFDLPIKTDETPSCRHSGCFVLCKMDKKRIAKSFCLGIQMKKV